MFETLKLIIKSVNSSNQKKALLADFKKILSDNPWLLMSGEEGITTLMHLAVKYYSKEAVEIILEIAKKEKLGNKVVNIVDESGYTPLHEASYGEGKQEIVKLLLKEGADICARNQDGYTPFHLMVQCGRIEALKLLFDSKLEFDIEVQTLKGETALHLAVKNPKCIEVVKFLLEHNANVNAQNKKGDTPLHLIAKKVDNKTVDILLEKYANNSLKDYEGCTPIHAIAEMLVNKGADHTIANSEKLTALDIARQNKPSTALEGATAYQEKEKVSCVVM
jgi:ankyrin repeat protein